MVQLVPMMESEFQMYSKSSVENYAQEHVPGAPGSGAAPLTAPGIDPHRSPEHPGAG